MGRRPIGERPLTGAERYQRHLAKKLAAAVAAAPPPPAPTPVVTVNVEHLRRYPDRVAPWLCQRLGRDATLALVAALQAALDEAAPEEEES